MWVRPSSAFYGTFSLDMDRSPGFGPAAADCSALLRLGFPAAAPLRGLTLPAVAARRTVLQKVRGHALAALPQFIGTRFQVLFHSPPGVLFTFPSQYYALSVTKRYLALRGGPRAFRQGSTCLDVLWIPPCLLLFRVRGLHPLWLAFPKPFPYFRKSLPRSKPHGARTVVWAFPVPLAATPGITIVFSSSGYLDVSVHRVPLPTL